LAHQDIRFLRDSRVGRQTNGKLSNVKGQPAGDRLNLPNGEKGGGVLGVERRREKAQRIDKGGERKEKMDTGRWEEGTKVQGGVSKE